MVDYRTRLRNVREDRDLTQAVIGELLNKSQQGYNHIETGRAELKIDDLVKTFVPLFSLVLRLPLKKNTSGSKTKPAITDLNPFIVNAPTLSAASS